MVEIVWKPDASPHLKAAWEFGVAIAKWRETHSQEDWDDLVKRGEQIKAYQDSHPELTINEKVSVDDILTGLLTSLTEGVI